MLNTIVVDGVVNFVVAKKQLPNGKFTQLSANIVQRDGRDEVHAIVTLNGGPEHGRMYSCYYSMRGTLLGACSVN